MHPLPTATECPAQPPRVSLKHAFRMPWEKQPTLTIAPCTVKDGMRRVKQWHRHLPELQGGLFAVQVLNGADCVGVGIAGNPSRVQQGKGHIVISRVATPGAENACSMIYGALCRAAKALGYSKAWTYTLPEESGTSLRAAGFMDMGFTDGGEWSRPSRQRKTAVRSEPKRRWLRVLKQTMPWEAQ
jgi:hypothetical protein